MNFLFYFISPCITWSTLESNSKDFNFKAPDESSVCRCWAHPVGEAQGGWFCLQLKRFPPPSNTEEFVWEFLRARGWFLRTCASVLVNWINHQKTVTLWDNQMKPDSWHDEDSNYFYGLSEF